MTHTRELHMVTKNEREIEAYFCHRLRRNKKTERKKRERKREEREKERKTQRQRGRQREKRQEGEKERWFLLPQTPQKQNKNSTNSFSVMMREPPPPSKLSLLSKPHTLSLTPLALYLLILDSWRELSKAVVRNTGLNDGRTLRMPDRSVCARSGCRLPSTGSMLAVRRTRPTSIAHERAGWAWRWRCAGAGRR